MKRNFILLVFIVACSISRAHNTNYAQVILKTWHLHKENKAITASFVLFKDGLVYLNDEKNNEIKTPLENLSVDEQTYVKRRVTAIEEINQYHTRTRMLQQEKPSSASKTIYFLAIVFLLIGVAYQKRKNDKLVYLIPVILVGIFIVFTSGESILSRKLRSMTSPAFIDSAFTPFKPAVHTFYDTNYFYVESKGIPTTHQMMTGISNHGWQQQVPIPQCYTGLNAWPIPLHPVMAVSSIPVDSVHFTRGAIAIAVNGVPIFNPHTNTGVDAYLDGQLDNYGGHCGRADDYHYHTAPLHLYGITTPDLPIAFALDGFPVYGTTEPDGSAMQPLDSHHGHQISGWMYHYHGTATAPYMIASFAGVVTEDTTHQLIPQPHANAVRPPLTPLSGALITTCIPNATGNGYTIIYTLSGQTDSIVYSWTATGVYTFKFYTTGDGTFTTSIYNGHQPCDVPNFISTLSTPLTQVEIYPNPFVRDFTLGIPDNNSDLAILIFDLSGRKVFQDQQRNEKTMHISLEQVADGTYFLLLLPKTGKAHAAIITKHEN